MKYLCMLWASEDEYSTDSSLFLFLGHDQCPNFCPAELARSPPASGTAGTASPTEKGLSIVRWPHVEGSLADSWHLFSTLLPMASHGKLTAPKGLSELQRC